MLDKNNPCVTNLAKCGLTLEKLEKLSVKSNLGISFVEDLGRFSKAELFQELQDVTDHYNNEAILTTIDIPFRIKDLNSMLHNYERYYYTKEANRVFNDILGFRSVYTNYDDVLAMELPEQFRISDMSHGKTIDDGYRGVHLHYQMDEFHYPIEIQFNTAWDLQFNQWLHKYVYKKSIPNIIGALLRRYYENGKIKSETDFKEVLNGGIFNRKG